MTKTRYYAPLPDDEEQKINKEVVKGNGEVAAVTPADNTNNKVETPADNKPQATLTAPVYKTTAQDQYTANNPMPERSAYTTNMEMYKTLTPPLSDEEIAARQRSASAVESIGHLGNAANAIANLIAVGNGARPQALPKADLADKQDKWYREMQEQRQRHAATLAQAKNADYDKYLKALSLWRSGLKDAADKDNDAYGRDLGKYKVDADIKDNEARRAEANRHNAAMEDVAIGNMQANRTRAAKYGEGKSGGDNKYIQIRDNNGNVKRYRKTDMSDPNVVASLYNQLVAENPDYSLPGEKGYDIEAGRVVQMPPKTEAMRAALMQAVEAGDYDIPAEYEIGGVTSDDDDNTPPMLRRGTDGNNTPPSLRKKNRQ